MKGAEAEVLGGDGAVGRPLVGRPIESMFYSELIENMFYSEQRTYSLENIFSREHIL